MANGAGLVKCTGEVNRGPALLMDEEDAISGGQDVVKPDQVLFERWGEGERASS